MNCEVVKISIFPTIFVTILLLLLLHSKTYSIYLYLADTWANNTRTGALLVSKELNIVIFVHVVQ